MNTKLAKSALFFGYLHIHYALSFHYWSHYMNFILIGLTSSFINHSFTDQRLVYLDRAITIVGLMLDTHILYYNDLFDKQLNMYIEYSAVFMYLLAKYTQKTSFHIMSHGLLTLSHFCIISSAYFHCRAYSGNRIYYPYRSIICVV